jgi:hypothetical protein
MRFFSNDKNSNEQSNVDVQNQDANDPSRVEPGPTGSTAGTQPEPVPQQRTGSPWSNAPGGTTDAEGTDRERADEPGDRPETDSTAKSGSVASSSVTDADRDRWSGSTDRD